MYKLIVKGPRNSTVAYHTLDSYLDLQELLAVYHALGFKPEQLLVEQREEAQAA